MSVLSKLQASNCRNKRRRGRGGTKKKCLASSEESFNIELVLTSSTKHQITKREVEKKAVPLSEDILETANRRLSDRAARLELEEQMQTKDALSRGSERDRLRDPRGRRAEDTHGPTGQPFQRAESRAALIPVLTAPPGISLFWLAQGSGFNPCFFRFKKLGNFFGKIFIFFIVKFKF